MDSENKTLETWVKCLAWAETNWRRLALGAAVLALAALVISYVVYQRNQTALLASQSLGALRPTPGPDRTMIPVPAESYLKVAADYPGTEAAARALLLAGGALFDSGKFTEALAQFERVQRDFPNSPFRPEALYGQAISLESLGRPAEAATALQALLSRYPTSSLAPRAKFALARVELAQKQPEKALKLLEEVSKAQDFGLLGALSEMMQEEIKQANPSLAARTVMATNTVNILPAPTNPPAASTNKP
jgi:TolA-binding protein